MTIKFYRLVIVLKFDIMSSGLIVGVGLFVLFVVGGLIRSIVWALKDEDVKEASQLRMNVRRYKLYKEIYEEQMECHRQGKKIPNRMDEIPNMNEWRRFGEYQLEKAHKSMMDELDELYHR